MSVIAKYQAFMQKNFETSGDKESSEKSKLAEDILDNLKIELSKTDELKKEPSNEAILMHVIEHFEKDEQDTVLECVFEYLNLIDAALQNIDIESEDGNATINEYYDVSRLGLILNCYLGGFDNDDFFYGTLADIAETVKAASKDDKTVALCDAIVGKIEKADINLAFRTFLEDLYKSSTEAEQKILYETMIKTYSESLLNKVLTEEVGEEEISKLACAKQIQRIYEKLMIL